MPPEKNLPPRKVKSSLFSDEQNELLDLIFENHTVRIREFLQHKLNKLEDGLEDELYTTVDKLRQDMDTRCEARCKEVQKLDKNLEILDTKFKMKSGLWGVLGGSIPVIGTILIYMLMKHI